MNTPCPSAIGQFATSSQRQAQKRKLCRPCSNLYLQAHGFSLGAIAFLCNLPSGLLSRPDRDKMGRWRIFFAMTAIFAASFSVGEAREKLIVGHKDDTSHNLQTLKVMDIFKDHGGNIDFGKFRNPIPFLERGLPRISNINFPQLQNVQNLVCDTCMDVSTLIEQVLTDPDTVNSALEFVDVSLCQNIPHLQQQCQNLASTYVPDLMETLEIYAAPNKLCGETKLCPSSAVLRLNDARACKMCTEFAEEALVYVQDSKTETEILDALHVQCAKLGDFESQCNMLVDVYGPLYISKLDSLTPDQVCQKARMCNAPSIRDPASCATCQFAVLQMKAKLQNPAVQEKMMQALIDQCNKVPAHTNQCKELLTQYGPFIFAHLDTYMNPETICAEIHACESKKKKTEDMVQLSFAADMEPAVHSS